MATGTLHVETKAAGVLPIAGAKVEIRDLDGTLLYTLTTDANGITQIVTLDAPPKENTLTPDGAPAYGRYDVTVSAPGYITDVIRGVEILDGIDSYLPLNLYPAPEEQGTAAYTIPAPAVAQNITRNQEGPRSTRVLTDVVIPDYITVHMGTYNSNAKNLRVPYIDYIKNVVSSEIYATWPDASLRANIYAIITFTLNRVYSEWYRARGYDFDITNSTTTDMAYVENRNIFSNISALVDQMFNQYVRRAGRRDPYFTQFCNGTTATCPGLSQWGTVDLANRGLNPMQILKSYYPSDIEIAESNNIGSVPGSYPGSPLQSGSSGAAVKRLQDQLNRIRVNYPAIPRINNPDGVYGPETVAAVKAFQKIFDPLPVTGVTDKATWYKISQIYTGVTKLGELDSEGERVGIGAAPPTSVIKKNSKGEDVTQLQFLLNALSNYYPMIPPVIQDGSFDTLTETSVKAFQSAMGLKADGIVGPATWNALYEAYKSLDTGGGIAPPAPPAPVSPAYPGYYLQYGQKGDNVATLQGLLNNYGYGLKVDGDFGSGTRNAVIDFQQKHGLTADGIVGEATWNALIGGGSVTPPTPTWPPFPGYFLKYGQQGDNVATLQKMLNAKGYNLKVDGDFGTGTLNAVRDFQQKYGLSVDGVVGKATWEALAN
ncbi:hypothetical protein FACS1894217_01140 [Clostridia bacterium]|nr:hypothetical protein FACS1894217_01140 [Clostridia bacterium]